MLSLLSVAEENRRNSERSLNVQPISERISNLQKEKDKDNVDRNLLDISREASVKDLTERLQVILNYARLLISECCIKLNSHHPL